MILVTGGAGFIGSHTCVELLNNQFEIIVVDNFTNSQVESLERVKKITGKDFPFRKCNLTDSANLEQIFVEYDIEAVIHFAGFKAVGESVSLPLKYYRNNILGTLVLCEVMQKKNVKNLVFSSSATVYGDPKTVPITEDFPLQATNPYGRTKLMIEEMLRDLFISDPTWNISILRYFNPVGAHNSGMLGEKPQGVPNNLMPYITEVAAGIRDKLYIYGKDYQTPDGTAIRDYIHVMDLALGHIYALQHLKESKGIQTYNLGTGKGYSVLELVKTFEMVNGLEIPYVFTERRPGDIEKCFADPTKAKRELGWSAERTIEDMCYDAWQWQKNLSKLT